MKVLCVSSANNIEGISHLAHYQALSIKSLYEISLDFYNIKGKGFCGYLKNIMPLRRQIIINSYDIIHAHYGLSGIVCLLAKNSQSRLIISYMGNDLLGNRDAYGKLTFWGKLIVQVNQLVSKYADFVIVKSEEMGKKIKVAKKKVIPNGVDLNLFYEIDIKIAQNKLGWNPNKKHILFLSSPERPEKNYRLIENAFTLFNKNKFQLHFIKDIPFVEMVYYYNASDVCVLTSFHEGSPNVVKEAMACNRPIVSTPVGDVIDIFGNEFGYYLCSYELFSFIEKLQEALNSAQEYPRTKGRDRILELGLDADNIARQVYNIYEKTLA